MSENILSITKSGTGTGTVTSDAGDPPGVSPPIDCGSTCSASVTGGITITFTATAASGSVFVGWTGDITSTSNPVSFLQPSGNSNINAEFRRRPQKKMGGAIGMNQHIYLNEQQIASLVSSNVLESNLASVQTFSVESDEQQPIIIPVVINHNRVAYIFSGVVDCRGNQYPYGNRGYECAARSSFFRYTMTNRASGSKWQGISGSAL